MNNDFFPDVDYKIPTDSKYMKFREGENTFRVLSSAVVGWEYWNVENKPVRLHEKPDALPEDIRFTDKGEPEKIKHFWAFVVWNYEDQKIQVLELTQKTVMNAIKALVDNKRWGNPKQYDITVTKSGTRLDTEYVVQGNPPLSLPATEILQRLKVTPVNLDALFDGGDPFNGAPEQEEEAPAQRVARKAVAGAQRTATAPRSSYTAAKPLAKTVTKPNPLVAPEEQAQYEEDLAKEEPGVVDQEALDETQKLADELGF